MHLINTWVGACYVPDTASWAEGNNMNKSGGLYAELNKLVIEIEIPVFLKDFFYVNHL